MKRQPLEQLAEFIAALRIEDLPSELRELAKLKVLDSLAVTYAGRDYEPVKVALQYARTLSAGNATSILGGQQLQAADAAFVNAVAIHSLLFDDVDLESGHPACTVMPAALAVGESCHASGADLLLGLVCGYEAMWRAGGCGSFLMRATSRGFRGNTILGAFGSAAAAAKVQRMSAAGTANALAAAASLAAGLLEPLNTGSMERSFQQANNSRQGVMAAALAKSGLNACLTVLDGGTGFYSAFADLSGFPEHAMDTLGDSYRMRMAYAKPYPSAGSNTVGIAVAELLRPQLAGAPQDIKTIDVSVLPRFTGNPGYPSIAFKGPFTTIEQALISFPFQIACMLLHGRVDYETIRTHLTDVGLASLADRVRLIGVEVNDPLDCSIQILDGDGKQSRADSQQIDWNQFHHTRAKAIAKFRHYASPVMDERQLATAIDSVLSLDAIDDISTLRSLISIPSTGGGRERADEG